MKLTILKSTLVLFVGTMLLSMSACSGDKTKSHNEKSEAQTQVAVPEVSAKPTSRFSAATLAENIKIFSSDEFEGRSPASKGETLTINFLADQLKQIGFAPGNGDSYFQEVPLVSITTSPDAALAISVKGQELSLKYGNDMIVWSKRVSEKEVLNNSDMVFVGYGIVAPEYNWNDYAGIDMKGKTALILVNDPGYATQNTDLFNGNAMTYYGRWTYKYEEAARQGAAGAIIIHQEDAAGYPWEVVSGSWSGAKFDLVAKDKNMSRVAVEGWMQDVQADKLFSVAGYNLADLKKQAMTQGFKPVSLGASVNTKIQNALKQSVSNNVIGILPGSTHPDEYLVYMAHWDHLGKDDELHAKTGDGIYNGASDNASGTAAIIEIANAVGKLKTKPERSIVILFVTAEEQGLLGSKHYATNPIYPLAQTAAGFNLDRFNVYGRTSNISVVGYGNSELEDYLKSAIDKQNRTMKQEPNPEKGFFYRSDQFSFAKMGVPVLYVKTGNRFIGKSVDYGNNIENDYIANRYHKVGDEFDPDWDFSGALEDMELLYEIGHTIANERTFPNWYKGNEFRSIRDESRK